MASTDPSTTNIAVATLKNNIEDHDHDHQPPIPAWTTDTEIAAEVLSRIDALAVIVPATEILTIVMIMSTLEIAALVTQDINVPMIPMELPPRTGWIDPRALPTIPSTIDLADIPNEKQSESEA